MRLMTVLCAVTMLAVAHVSWAQEHPACANLAHTAKQRDSKQLRSIAASCSNPSVRELYYNRALHLELVTEAKVMEGLIEFRAPHSSNTMLGHQMYIALIEAVAPVWFPDLQERLEFLNGEYERRGEIARLRLRGYDPLADRLERQSGGLPLPTSVD